MGTWKRLLEDGQVCEDSRVEFNPTLGQGKPVEVIAEVEAPAPVKGKKNKVEIEAPVVIEEPAIEVVPEEVAE